MAGRHLGVFLLAIALALPGAAQNAIGPETGLPLPRYVSLKANEANIRRGPGFDHRIDWVFTHRSMPLRVVAEFDVWRQVEDIEGEGGWIHSTLLSGTPTVIVLGETMLRARASERGREIARVEAGVVALRDTCERDWCRIEADGYRGWVERSLLWGALEER
ncbi:MAG: SH3 domain-containing protein [Rubricella sp.]